jgi:hypothetical protein
MEDDAAEVLLRIDECARLATKLNLNGSEESERKLQEDVDRVIEEELQNDSCSSTIPFLQNGSIPFTRVTDIVGHFLDTNKDSPAIICRKYPKVSICTDEQ